MLLILVGCAVPLWISSYATALWQFLLLGLALGLVGASFSVGTPYVARFFPKESRGFAMGFFGAGTTGAALNMFVAPLLIGSYGWQWLCHVAVPRARSVGALGIVRQLRLQSATLSSRRCEARGAFGRR